MDFRVRMDHSVRMHFIARMVYRAWIGGHRARIPYSSRMDMLRN